MECFDPSVTKNVELGAKCYLLNEKNYLKNFDDWDEQIRDWLAMIEKIELRQDHLYIIELLRNLYFKNKKHPILRMVTTDITIQLGAEKGTVKYFHRLYPGGIHQAFLIAGLPMQDSCC